MIQHTAVHCRTLPYTAVYITECVYTFIHTHIHISPSLQSFECKMCTGQNWIKLHLESLEGGSPSTASQRQRDSRRRNRMRRGEAGKFQRPPSETSENCKAKRLPGEWYINDPRDTWNPQTWSIFGIPKAGDTVKWDKGAKKKVDKQI